MGGLNCTGILWALLSLIATFLIAGGLIWPEWLVGSITAGDKTLPAYFGSYKRCNYPVFDLLSRKIGIVEDCARYATLSAVPSEFWQFSVLSVGGGAALSLLLTLLLIVSVCCNDVITKANSVVVGFFQIVASILVCLGCVAYPLGWDNPEVRDACGPQADKYALGSCRVGQSYMAMVVGAGMLVICALLSLAGGKSTKKHQSLRQHPSQLERGPIISAYEPPVQRLN